MDPFPFNRPPRSIRSWEKLKCSPLRLLEVRLFPYPANVCTKQALQYDKFVRNESFTSCWKLCNCCRHDCISCSFITIDSISFLTPTANRKIAWATKNQDQILVSVEQGGTVLKIKKDGYFLLNLQVTLSPCNGTMGSLYTVSLNSSDTVILQGGINTNTCSTGLLGKVEELAANDSLEVTIKPQNEAIISIIDDHEYLTHLDIVFFPRN